MLIKNSNKTTVARKQAAVRLTAKAQPSAPVTPKGSWKESRPAVVARARKLLKNPNYPSPKVLNSMARLLAKHLA
jgi:hypothetical protein